MASTLSMTHIHGVEKVDIKDDSFSLEGGKGRDFHRKLITITTSHGEIELHLYSDVIIHPNNKLF